MNRRSFLSLAAGAARAGADAPRDSYDVTAFGAVGDGARNNREAIQRAVDQCAARGGGTVRLPPGRFLSGALRLKSGVALWLDHGATLAASPDPSEYPLRRPTERLPRDQWGSVFVLAEGAERVAILGSGVITGGGFGRPHGPGRPLQPFRPRLVAFERCRDVAVRGVTLRDPDRWTLHFYQCDSAQAHGLRIRAGYAIGNSDGIDVDGSRNVVISDCEIVAGDDCIVLKTTNYLGPPRPCENVVVSNCVLSTRANALKIGTETHADFSNIAFTNSAVFGDGDIRPISGVALEAVDGARLRGVSVSNISMRRVKAALFLRAGDRSRPQPGAPASRLEDVVIDNIVAVDATVPSSITGIPASAVENVTVRGVRINIEGGAEPWPPGRQVPEREAAYPDATMFGPLPAHGLYLRHARGIRLRDVHFLCERPDGRPPLITEDVSDLEIEGLRSSTRGRT